MTKKVSMAFPHPPRQMPAHTKTTPSNVKLIYHTIPTYLTDQTGLNDQPTDYVHEGSPLVPILSHMHSVHNFPPYFPKIHSNIISHLCLSLPSDLFYSGFSPKYFISFSLLPCVLHVPLISVFSI